MKNFLGFIVIILFLVSCAKVKRPPKPDNLIPKGKMVNIILDISLLRSSEGSNRVKLKKEGYNAESYIYKKHNIDSLQFVKSNEYYSYDLDAYKDIYQKVEDSLEALKVFYEGKRDSIMEGRREKSDSISPKKEELPEVRERKLKEVKDSLAEGASVF